MFTGIIEEKATISAISKTSQGALISVKCEKILDDLKLGDSVAVDGACQTVVKLRSDGFDVEAANETLNLTTFSDFRQGRTVNLERAMPANGRFGGHIVSGHVENTGNFVKERQEGFAKILYFSAPKEVAKYLVYKGSITINGVSLTIASLDGSVFSVSAIPLTLAETNLASLSIGEKVNLEPDIFAKYIEKFLFAKDNKTENITMNYLEEHGFLS